MSVRSIARGAGVAAALLAFLPAGSEAQVADVPFQGLFGGEPRRSSARNRNEYGFRFTLTGGYDDNLRGESGDLPIEVTPETGEISGYNATAALDARYARVSPRRSFSINGMVAGAQYSYIESTSRITVAGGGGASTAIGRKASVSGNARVGREPYLQLGGFNTLRQVVGPDETPGSTLPYSLADRISYTYDADAAFVYRPSRTDVATVGYNYTFRDFSGGPQGDGRSQDVTVSYDKALSRAWGIGPSYTYTRGRYSNELLPTPTEEPVTERPVTQHGIRGSVRYSRRLSPTKNLSLSGGGGATQVNTVNELGQETSLWEPSGEAMARVDLARTWALDASYRRALVYLGGVTNESYFSDAMSVGVAGLLARRLRLSLSGAMATGNAAAFEGSDSSFRSYTATVSFGYSVMRNASLSVGYIYYMYRFNGTTAPSGLPPDFNRNGVRAAFSIIFPPTGRGQALQ